MRSRLCARSVVVSKEGRAPFARDPVRRVLNPRRRFELNVGIVLTTKRLQRALNRIALLRQETEEYYGNFRVTPDLFELRNLVVHSALAPRSALHARFSRDAARGEGHDPGPVNPPLNGISQWVASRLPPHGYPLSPRGGGAGGAGGAVMGR